MSFKIVIQVGANHVTNLDWDASTSKDVVGYNVYRSPDAATWKRINISLNGPTLYTDSTVANGSTYYYAATAVDVNGKESYKPPHQSDCSLTLPRCSKSRVITPMA